MTIDEIYLQIAQAIVDEIKEEWVVATINAGGSDWNRAKFTLYPTGKFNVEFEWDQELADEIASHAK